MVVAEFTVITFLFDFRIILISELGDIILVVVDPIKKCVEGGAEVKTASASTADIINAIGFLF